MVTPHVFHQHPHWNCELQSAAWNRKVILPVNFFSHISYYLLNTVYSEQKMSVFPLRRGVAVFFLFFLLFLHHTLGEVGMVCMDFQPGVVSLSLTWLPLDELRLNVPCWDWVINHFISFLHIWWKSSGATNNKISFILLHSNQNLIYCMLSRTIDTIHQLWESD